MEEERAVLDEGDEAINKIGSVLIEILGSLRELRSRVDDLENAFNESQLLIKIE